MDSYFLVSSLYEVPISYVNDQTCVLIMLLWIS